MSLIKKYTCNECTNSEAAWIVYFNVPTNIKVTGGPEPPRFLYLCPGHTCERMLHNHAADDFRIVEVRYLFDAMNQMGGAGVLASLPTRT